MEKQLQLKLFSSPQIIYQEQVVTGFVSDKARALLIYLAVTRRAHSRAALAELLWADTPATTRKNLKKALSNLRNLDGVRLIAYVEQFGTREPAGFLAVPTAIDYMAEHNWDEVRQQCFTMALATKRELEQHFDSESICPESFKWFSQLCPIHRPAATDMGNWDRFCAINIRSRCR